MVNGPRVTTPGSSRGAVIIPVKAFAEAKERLSAVLDPTQRYKLARTTAQGVLSAVLGVPIFVVSNDPEVAKWATTSGASIVAQVTPGLNGAVEAGITAAKNFDWVMIVHSDLPQPATLRSLFDSVVEDHPVILVPDRRTDGTNVLIIPIGAGFRVAYGPQSFAKHLTEAQRLGFAAQIVQDPHLALDIDTPDDLAQLPSDWLTQHVL
ncbi:MAG: 2-phospho-L-lactate guanylyltransferase [Actinobacteria bacterium]|nr:MAG: 2-phospho-L-lactate guanylyltransferase [Actinomycetota bacterium]